MDRQKTILSQYGNKKIRENIVGSSIELLSAKSYSRVSGRFSHSGSHILIANIWSCFSVLEGMTKR